MIRKKLDLKRVLAAWRFAIAAITLGSLLCTTSTAADPKPRYKFVDLGMGGAVDINNSRQIVVGGGVWSDGVMTPLPTFRGQSVTAIAINNGGVVAANAVVDGVPKAFVFANGQLTELGSIDHRFDRMSAQAINDRGDIVGASSSTTGRGQHATLWSNGSAFDLGLLAGSTGGYAGGVNDSQEVSGISNLPSAQRATLWARGIAAELPLLPDGYNNWAQRINNRGDVIGGTFTTTGIRATLWKDGRPINLGTLGGYYSYASDINNRGQVVGIATTGDHITSQRAALWSNGVAINLDDYIDPQLRAEGWELNMGYAINDRGDIVGIARHPISNQQRAFALFAAQGQ